MRSSAASTSAAHCSSPSSHASSTTSRHCVPSAGARALHRVAGSARPGRPLRHRANSQQRRNAIPPLKEAARTAGRPTWSRRSILVTVALHTRAVTLAVPRGRQRIEREDRHRHGPDPTEPRVFERFCRVPRRPPTATPARTTPATRTVATGTPPTAGSGIADHPPGARPRLKVGASPAGPEGPAGAPPPCDAGVCPGRVESRLTPRSAPGLLLALLGSETRRASVRAFLGRVASHVPAPPRAGMLPDQPLGWHRRLVVSRQVTPAARLDVDDVGRRSPRSRRVPLRRGGSG